MFSRGRFVSTGAALYTCLPFLGVAAVLVWLLGPLMAFVVWISVCVATVAMLVSADVVMQRYFKRREMDPSFEAKYGPAPHTWARTGAGFWDATLRPAQYLVHDPVVVHAGTRAI